MAEDASMRRLRRLMGNQRFEAEVIRGKAAQEQEEVERHQSEKETVQSQQADGPADGKHNTMQYVTVTPQTIATGALQTTSATRQESEILPQPSARRRLPRRAKIKSSPYSDTESETDPEGIDLEPHEEAAAGATFCPIHAVAKYPYKHLTGDKQLMERVADSCFNNGQFWERSWSIFYIHPPETVSDKPIFFVPAHEVQRLFDEVSRSIAITCGFPVGRLASGFQVSFTAKEPRPKYLGVSRSRDEFNIMDKSVPSRSNIKGAWSRAGDGDDRFFKVWQAKLEAAQEAGRQKKQKSKAEATSKRAASKQQWVRQLYRSQRYLGLRGPNAKEAKGATANYQDELARLQVEKVPDDPELPPELDATQPSRFPFDQDVVFIAIDLEANESAQHIVTEIGISTLDTRDIQGTAPGQKAEAWRSKIKYRHFRIWEQRHVVNHKHVHGCPDRFEKAFGESEFISAADIPSVVAMTCKPPFPMNVAEREAIASKLSYDQVHAHEPRKIVLVGHDFEADVQFLRRSGLQILKLSGIIEVLDTSMIWRAVVHETDNVSLERVLSMCGIAAWNLHNAGNDAGYTMQAMLAMAVDHLADPKHAATEKERAQRRIEAMKLAAERADDDFREWIVADRGTPSVRDGS